MSTPIFPFVDRALGGRLVSILTRYRGEGLTYAQISRELHNDHAVDVTPETVRKWCIDNDLSAIGKSA